MRKYKHGVHLKAIYVCARHLLGKVFNLCVINLYIDPSMIIIFKEFFVMVPDVRGAEFQILLGEFQKEIQNHLLVSSCLSVRPQVTEPKLPQPLWLIFELSSFWSSLVYCKSHFT